MEKLTAAFFDLQSASGTDLNREPFFKISLVVVDDGKAEVLEVSATPEVIKSICKKLEYAREELHKFNLQHGIKTAD